MNPKYFKIFVDTGGTFTYCIGVDETGNEYRQKVLSSSSLRGTIKKVLSVSEFEISNSWQISRDILKGFSFRILGSDYSDLKIASFNINSNVIHLNKSVVGFDGLEGKNFEITSNEEAPVLGARLITQTALDEDFPDLNLKLGSTKGTNALLESKGAKTLFIVTKGFKDLLQIGNQSRPDIFAMNVQKLRQITNQIIEVNERIDAKGNILKPLNIVDFSKQLNQLNSYKIEAVAITLMNSYINPVHEIQIAKLLHEQGFQFVSVSTQLSPLIKILNRAQTTVVNSYLSPIIHNYVNRISEQIGNQSFQIMTSAGGLVPANNFFPKDSLLSGLAGGVVGAHKIGKQSGFTKLITFDMGGTSTDVSRIDKEFDYLFELEVGNARINSPAIAIETVAAGGGSICGFDGYKLFVGSESAGLLSAYGIGNAAIERFAERQILKNLNDIYSEIPNLFSQIEKKAAKKLTDEGFQKDEIQIRQKMVFLRFKGQDSNLEIPFTTIQNLISEFNIQYEKIYGHTVSTREIEVEAIRVIASIESVKQTIHNENIRPYFPKATSI